MMRDEKQNGKQWQSVAALLGFANKAGKLKFGMSACCHSCSAGKAKLVLQAENLSRNSQNKIASVISQNNIRKISYGTKEQFGRLFNRTNTGLICIEDKNFASGIEKAIA